LVSRADVIAIGAILAVSSCGGPIIPLRGGRVDSWQAGATGTPEPQQDLATFTEQFRKQGFTQTEMIKLVACGHTMGGVRSSDFPELVPPNPASTEPVIVDFDTTMAFDNEIVTEYLDGSTQNVLVVTSNKTMASDLRVFEADNNATMKGLADKTVFQSECKDILSRMLDTVQTGVTLTDEITLLPAKVAAAQLTFEKNQLVFKSTFRLTQAINATANPNRNVTMLWCDKRGDNANCVGKKTSAALSLSKLAEDPNISPVTQDLGFSFINYNFVVPIASNASISKFWFQVDEKDGSTATTYDNGGSGYVIDQDNVLFVPTLSHMDIALNTSYTQTYTNRDTQTYTRKYQLVAAVRDGTNPSRVYADAADVAVPSYAFAMTNTVDFTQNSTAFPATSGYSFYTAQIDDAGIYMTMDLHAVTGNETFSQQFVQTLVLDNTPIVAPGAVTTVASTTTGASAALGRTVSGTLVAFVAVLVGAAALCL
jgi:hypothetical protein